MASLSYLLCWEYSPEAAFCWHTMIILFRTSHGRADSLPLTSPGLTKIAQNISHIALDGLSSQHRKIRGRTSGSLLDSMRKRKGRASHPALCLSVSADFYLFQCPQGTFNATVVATLKRHYPERFAT
jgi:hypothetical protein